MDNGAGIDCGSRVQGVGWVEGGKEGKNETTVIE